MPHRVDDWIGALEVATRVYYRGGFIAEICEPPRVPEWIGMEAYRHAADMAVRVGAIGHDHRSAPDNWAIDRVDFTFWLYDELRDLT